MAKRKLSNFSADMADDAFTPTVKTVKGGEVKESEKAAAPKKKRTQAPVKSAEPKTAAKPVDAAPKVQEAPAPKPEPAVEPKAAVKSEAKPAPKPAAKPAPQPPVAKDDAINEILQNKSRAVARHAAGDEDGEEVIQLVGFNLADEEFGVGIQEVREINRTMDITPVPRTPDFVEGVINLRGKVIPVINMRIRFRLSDAEKTNQTRIVIVEVDGKTVGMRVDSVSEVLRISSKTIEPPPDIVSGVDSEYIYGVAKLEDRLLILLDLTKVISNVDTRKGDTA